jgi:hypothetical protein
MQEKRVFKSIDSSKVKINNYLNNEKVEVINDIETKLIKQKLICVNFEDYMRKKINTKNIMHSIIICIISIIVCLRFLFSAYTTDPEILVFIADLLYLIGDRVSISVAIALVILFSVKARMIFLLNK